MKVLDLHIQSNHYPLEPQKIYGPKIPNTGEAAGQSGAVKKPFAEVLQETLSDSPVNFSAHALKRLQEREMSLSADELTRLNSGLEQLDKKGSQKSVILIDQTAYIVSVKNRMVVTAIDQAAAEANIFTNIDSVAIV